MYRIVYLIILTVILNSCATHVERLVLIPPGENNADTLRVYLQEKKKNEGKMLIIFQPQESFDTKSHLELGQAWMKNGFDVVMLEYPYQDNPMLRKSSVTLTSRLYDYITLYQYFSEKWKIETTHFLSVEYGLPWALSFGEMLPPDVLIIHKGGILTPFHNLMNIMEHNDTLSTNSSWKPVDSSVDKHDAYVQLKENLATKSFSGVFEFDNISDVLWNEMESIDIQNQIVKLKTNAFWTMPKNYHKMSKMGLEILQAYALSFGQDRLRFYDAIDKEQPHKLFEGILESLDAE